MALGPMAVICYCAQMNSMVGPAATGGAGGAPCMKMIAMYNGGSGEPVASAVGGGRGSFSTLSRQTVWRRRRFGAAGRRRQFQCYMAMAAAGGFGGGGGAAAINSVFPPTRRGWLGAAAGGQFLCSSSVDLALAAVLGGSHL